MSTTLLRDTARERGIAELHRRRQVLRGKLEREDVDEDRKFLGFMTRARVGVLKVERLAP